MARASNYIGIAMGIDVSDIKAGLREVKKSIKESKAEFENSVSSIQNWQKTSEGLNAKLQQLGKTLNAQGSLVKGYQVEIETVKKKEGDHTAELEKLQNALLKAQTDYNKTQVEIDKYSQSLAEIKEKEIESSSAYAQLNNSIGEQEQELRKLEKAYKSSVLETGEHSTESKGLASQIKVLNKELKENEEKLEKAGKSYNSLTNNVTKTHKEINILGKSISATQLGWAGVTAMVVKFTHDIISAVENTVEFSQGLNQMKSAYEDVGLTVEDATKTYEDLYSILGDDAQAKESASQIALMAKNTEDLNDWVDIATGAYAKFGKSLPTKSLLETANQTAKTGELTGALSDVLKRTGVNVEDFKEQLAQSQDESSRLSLITSTLTDQLGDAGTQYKELNAEIIEQNKTQVQSKEMLAQIGDAFRPLYNEVKTFFTESKGEWLPTVQKLGQTFLNFFNAIKPVLGTINDIINTILDGVNAVIKMIDKAIKAMSKWKIFNKNKKGDNEVTTADTAETAETTKVKVEVEVNKPQIQQAMEEVKDISDQTAEQTTQTWEEKLSELFNAISDYFSDATSMLMNFMTSFTDLFAQLGENEQSALDAQLEAYKEQKERELETLTEANDEATKANEEAYRQGKIDDKQYYKNKEKLETNLAKKQAQIQKEQEAEEKRIAKEKDKIARKQFEAEKANSITEATINGIQAIMKNFAKYGWIVGGVMNIVQAATTAAQIATIASQKYTGVALAKGGVVDEPTHALIGEDGKEAVVPLEKNTGWINELAQKLNEISQRDYNINNANDMRGAGDVYNYNNYSYNQNIQSPKSLTRREIYRDTRNLLSLRRA